MHYYTINLRRIKNFQLLLKAIGLHGALHNAKRNKQKKMAVIANYYIWTKDRATNDFLRHVLFNT